jgi:release factor glutamine methyltransferase
VNAPPPTTVRDLFGQARAAGVDRADAMTLLAHLTGQPRAWLVAHDDVPLDAGHVARCTTALARLAAGEPLGYVTGEQAFHGLTLRVDARVLVPRPDTETLVDWALEILRQHPAGYGPAAADLGTGSGAIALALKLACPAAVVTACDRSVEALAVARGNARRLGLAVDFAEGSWWDAVGDRRFDLALSNPPYIAEGDAHLEALRHEPRQALTAGADGLDDLRQIVAGAPEHLRPGAWLLLEHGFDQAGAVQDLLALSQFTDISTRHDLGGRPRCTGGRRPRPRP